MSKLSPTLKALISAAHAKPNTLPAPPQIRGVYERLRKEGEKKNVGGAAWLTLSTAATMTMNSPESLTELWKLATENSKDGKDKVRAAELMREVGLKCIGFNGVPRTINCLGAFRNSLPEEIINSLSTTPTRIPTQQNLPKIISNGQNLWKSIYAPFDKKLVDKLASSHPDLPVHILNHEYGGLFSAAPSSPPTGSNIPVVGRVLTSLIAISCLRAQTGVGPQVTSHVFGLRKAFEDGSAEGEGEEVVEGGKWLASDEGGVWVLEGVDGIVEALGGGEGSSFAPVRAKL